MPAIPSVPAACVGNAPVCETAPLKIDVPLYVLLPFSSGTVAPLVPMMEKVSKPDAALTALAIAVITLALIASQAMTVVAEFTIAQGAVAPVIVVVPGMIVVADPPLALITPADAVIVVPSTLTNPNWLALPSWIAGAASDRMNVVATPLTAVLLAVALGFAPAGAAAGVCQLAAVPLVAVRTCPAPGAVAPLTTIVVVAEFSAFAVVAIPAVKLAAVPVAFVSTIELGVPPAPLKVTNAPAFPTATASAVATFAPKPVSPPNAIEAAVMDVLQLKPVPLVQLSALPAVLHDGTAKPLGVVAVNAPRSWFAASAGSWL